MEQSFEVESLEAMEEEVMEEEDSIQVMEVGEALPEASKDLAPAKAGLQQASVQEQSGLPTVETCSLQTPTVAMCVREPTVVPSCSITRSEVESFCHNLISQKEIALRGVPMFHRLRMCLGWWKKFSNPRVVDLICRGSVQVGGFPPICLATRGLQVRRMFTKPLPY